MTTTTKVAPHEKTQAELEAATKRYDELTTEAQKVESKLAQCEKDLQSAILARKNAGQIETEIMGLQIKRTGFQKAIASQLETINTLKAKFANEENKHFLAVAETLKDQYVAQNDVVYSRLSQALEEAAKLKTIGMEYWRAVGKARAMQDAPHNSKIKQLANRVISMEQEVRRILSTHKK